MNSPKAGSSIGVRKKGAIRLLVGLAVFIPLNFALVFLSQHLGNLVIPIGLLLPGAYALSGLAEMITGVSFVELARSWDELKGWQRGVFGTLIVLVALVIIIFVFAFVVSRFV